MKPAVILVGADKGGVGKTTISRAVLDYLASKSIPARAFDTESPRGALHRFHPHETSIVDITETADQMKILDTLSDSAAKATVIDVRAGQMTETLKALRDVGFLDAVDDGQFTFIIVHVLGPSVSSLGEIAEIAPFVQSAHYFLAKNHINDTTFFEWDPKSYASYFGDVECAGEITIPKLDEMAYEQVELNGVPFADFVAGKQGSFVLRGYVRTWMRNITQELDAIGLHTLIAPELRRA
ncbi:MAG: hypothetical protein RIQ68_480 [Pseudomonadota bacterium]|jgi:hypothetical protein